MKKTIVLFALLFSGVISCGNKESKTEAVETAQVVGHKCPMDCEKGKVYDAAGTCPVCKMDLVSNAEEMHESHDGHDHE